MPLDKMEVHRILHIDIQLFLNNLLKEYPFATELSLQLD